MATRRRIRIILNSNADVSRFFGVGRHTVEDWIDKGCPGRISKTEYDLTQMVEWWGKNVAAVKWGRTESDSLADLKVVQMEQKIRQQKLSYAKEVQAVLPRVHVKEILSRLSELYRRAGELLRKHHGDDAQKILHDAIDAAEKEVKSMLERQ